MDALVDDRRAGARGGIAVRRSSRPAAPAPTTSAGAWPGVTEIQAGSYALMDTDYGEVGVPFEQAFFVLGTS